MIINEEEENGLDADTDTGGSGGVGGVGAYLGRLLVRGLLASSDHRVFVESAKVRTPIIAEPLTHTRVSLLLLTLAHTHAHTRRVNASSTHRFYSHFHMEFTNMLT